MIYSMYFDGMMNRNAVEPYYRGHIHSANKVSSTLAKFAGETFNARELVAEHIKTNKDCSYVFILVPNQLEKFTEWVKEFNLEEYEAFRFARPITNGNHASMGRRLTMVILTSKDHMWESMFEEEVGEEDAEN